MKINIEEYRKLNMKLTPQRIAILKYLKGNKTHPSAEQVYKHVLTRFPSVSYATVYNVLNKLVKIGLLKELNIEQDKKRFDPDIHSHHHLICTRCKNIIDINVNYELIVPQEQLSGFKVTSNHITFYGICPQCLKKEKNKTL